MVAVAVEKALAEPRVMTTIAANITAFILISLFELLFAGGLDAAKQKQGHPSAAHCYAVLPSGNLTCRRSFTSEVLHSTAMSLISPT